MKTCIQWGDRKEKKEAEGRREATGQVSGGAAAAFIERKEERVNQSHSDKE